MFKKGQLVRNKDDNRYLTVTENQNGPLVMVRTLYGAGGIYAASSLQHIGNNYRAKPKCSR